MKKVLGQLGIADASFKVMIRKIEADKDSFDYIISQNKKYVFSETGFDEVEFYISTNTGEDLKPLAKVTPIFSFT